MIVETFQDVHNRLEQLADPERAQVLQRFFKTGHGEYGEGDRFWGLRVPQLRILARQYRELPIPQVLLLLRSPFHEARLLALLILIRAYAGGDDSTREQIYRAYLDNTRFINSWDLVDVSAEHIVGAHLRHRDRAPLHALVASTSLWERRIAVLASFHFIKLGEFSDTLRLAERLLKDSEDLIHKAVGWMLREIGKRDREVEEEFLRAHARGMPRTMLRYAIEKFPEDLRQHYLRGG